MPAGGQPALGRGDRPGHGALADQLEAALAHRWLIEQAKGVIMGRERLDAQAAFERLRGAARSSTRRLADVARDVTDGQPLPANRRTLAKARGRTGQAAGERLRTIGLIGQDLRFDVRFSPFHLVDADGDGAPSWATTRSSTTSCSATARRSVTRVAPARSSTSSRG
jgi:hypothetical protein